MGRSQGKRGRARKPRTLRTETYGKGSIYQDKRGVWWYQPPPKDGRRLTRIRAASEQAARLAQKDHLAKREQGVAVSDIPLTKEWFEFWLREHVAPGLEASTVAWYRYLMEHYILPAIGEIRLDAVTSDRLILLQNQLRQHLALRTVGRIHELLNRSFRKATVARKIPFNPMDAVERPRVPRTKQESFTEEEIAAIRKAVRGHRLEPLYDLAFLQGFRRGELLGLLISEYDRTAGTIKVSGQVQTVAGTTQRKGKGKSDNATRIVPLTPRQQQLLEAHLAWLAEERARLGTDWKEHGLLFPSTKGTPIIPRNLNRHFYDLLVDAGVIASEAPPEKQPGMSGPRRTKRIATGEKEALHKLRHTAATRFDTVKATKAQQKAIMGHSPGDVTEGYVHPPLTELRAVLVAAEREMLRWAAERESRQATKGAGH